MATDRAARLPTREDPQRASYVELFFDLAFIFALAELTRAATAAGNEMIVLGAAGANLSADAHTLGGGAFLFLLSRVLATVVCDRLVPWSRVAGLVAMVGVKPVTSHLPPAATAATVDLILLVIAVTDRVRRSARQR